MIEIVNDLPAFCNCTCRQSNIVSSCHYSDMYNRVGYNRKRFLLIPFESANESIAMKVVVGIATAGRPEILCATLKRIEKQTLRPDNIIICAPTRECVAGVLDSCREATIIIGSRGLTHQRNAILEASVQHDLIVFFDDDFFPDPNYLKCFQSTMTAFPDVVVCTGHVISDGARTQGLTVDEADALIDADRESGTISSQIESIGAAYGCNMGIRLGPLLKNCVYFDEALPLYGWLEDLDFGARASKYGSIVKVHALRGVHLGVKSARQSGRRLGYSQIANPIYLVGKRSMTPGYAFYFMSRNMAANFGRTISPEPWVDRRGRLVGNFLALRDLLLGRIHPGNVVSL